jgi:colanic acid biosynthesis protein WcaH
MTNDKCHFLAAMPIEPRPGQPIAPEDFAAIVRLTPLVSIDLIVRDATRRVLVGRRLHEPARGSYFVPGGRITKNELRAAAFRRVCRMELGRECEMTQARFIGTFDHVYPTNALGQPGFGTHYVVLAFELSFPDTDWVLPKEQHVDYLWATDAEILGHPEVHENAKAYFRQ